MAFQFPEVDKHEHALNRWPDPEPPKLPHWTATVLDAEAWASVDPLQPSVFPFFAPPGVEAYELRVGDVVAVRFEASASRVVAPGLRLTLAARERLVEQHGHDDTGEMSETPDEFFDEAKAAIAPRLALAGQATGLGKFREEGEADLRDAEDVCRGYGLSEGTVGRLVGRPYVPRRGLYKPAAIARELAKAKRQREEELAKARESLAAVRVEEERPKTLGERRWYAFAVRVDRLGAIPFLVPTEGAAPIGYEPWTAASRYYSFDLSESRERVYAVRALAAMSSPPWARDGVRTLPPDTVVPPNALPAADPDMHAIAFLCARRIECGLDFGRVSGLRAEVPPIAHALCREYARFVLSPAPQHSWRTDWLIEVLTRSELAIRPDAALEWALLPALDAEFKRQNPPTMRPASVAHIEHTLEGKARYIPPTMKEIRMYLDEQLPSRTMRAVLDDKCAAAVARGAFVAVREALDPMLQPAAKSKKGPR